MSADQLDLELPTGGPAVLPVGPLFRDGGDRQSVASSGEEAATAATAAPKLTPPSRITDVPRPSPGREPAASGDGQVVDPPAGHQGIVTLAVGAPTVLGVDLSLTGTGVATLGWSTVFGTAPAGLKDQADDLRRIRLISAFVLDTARKTGPRLVVLEGPSYDSSGGHAHSRAGLWWKVYDTLADWHYPVAVITPSQLKLYALGKGAGKDTDKAHVLAACVRTFAWYTGANDNSADAIWLAAMGAEQLGHPFVEMPVRNRTALDKVAWPS